MSARSLIEDYDPQMRLEWLKALWRRLTAKAPDRYVVLYGASEYQGGFASRLDAVVWAREHLESDWTVVTEEEWIDQWETERRL